jgi:mannose-6-phosphate isomerase-like protein (cupin superfamily)
MRETTLPDAPDAISPAGAEVRRIMDGDTGGMIHSTVPSGQTNRAVVHATVSEFWYILEGHGEIWRKDHEQERVTTLVPGVSIDIPVGTAFQYRNVGTNSFKFICVTMPKWPGVHESAYVEGIWKPSR